MLIKQILDILNEYKNEKDNALSGMSAYHIHIEIKKESDRYIIIYGAMYNSPCSQLSLDKLIKLSELFGTIKIDVDDYSYGGCESCDYGSDYGHEIQIYKATKNLKELEDAVGKYDDKRLKKLGV